MGSLSPSGQPLVKATNILRHSHRGNFINESDTSLDASSRIDVSGVIDLKNAGLPFGVEFASSPARSFISGMPLELRDLRHNASGEAILRLEFDKFVNDSGNLQHVVTRQMGLHVSVQDRESPNTALGPMVARTERKIFEDSWTIFDGSGCPVGTPSGITDTDISPEPTYDQPC